MVSDKLRKVTAVSSKGVVAQHSEGALNWFLVFVRQWCLSGFFREDRALSPSGPPSGAPWWSELLQTVSWGSVLALRRQDPRASRRRWREGSR